MTQIPNFLLYLQSRIYADETSLSDVILTKFALEDKGN